MKELISLNYDGNKARFFRSNDGDLWISMTTGDEYTHPDYRGTMHAVRVGVGNSGGQEVPFYVKIALSKLIDAFEKWDKEE